jgi:hypothetical protein
MGSGRGRSWSGRDSKGEIRDSKSESRNGVRSLLVDPGEDVARVYGLALFGGEFFYGAGFGGFDFVLHFHGFDDDEALTGFDFVAGFDEQADYFAGHGGDDLLAAFGFDRSVFAAAPGAGVGDFGFELVGTILKRERTIWIWRNANFVRNTIQQDGENARRDFRGVGLRVDAIECDLPSSAVAAQFYSARFAGDVNLVLHGVRSS